MKNRVVLDLNLGAENQHLFLVIAQSVSGALHLTDALHREFTFETRTAIIMPNRVRIQMQMQCSSTAMILSNYPFCVKCVPARICSSKVPKLRSSVTRLHILLNVFIDVTHRSAGLCSRLDLFADVTQQDFLGISPPLCPTDISPRRGKAKMGQYAIMN